MLPLFNYNKPPIDNRNGSYHRRRRRQGAGVILMMLRDERVLTYELKKRIKVLIIKLNQRTSSETMRKIYNQDSIILLGLNPTLGGRPLT